MAVIQSDLVRKKREKEKEEEVEKIAVDLFLTIQTRSDHLFE